MVKKIVGIMVSIILLLFGWFFFRLKKEKQPKENPTDNGLANRTKLFSSNNILNKLK